MWLISSSKTLINCCVMHEQKGTVWITEKYSSIGQNLAEFFRHCPSHEILNLQDNLNLITRELL